MQWPELAPKIPRPVTQPDREDLPHVAAAAALAAANTPASHPPPLLRPPAAVAPTAEPSSATAAAAVQLPAQAHVLEKPLQQLSSAQPAGEAQEAVKAERAPNSAGLVPAGIEQHFDVGESTARPRFQATVNSNTKSSCSVLLARRAGYIYNTASCSLRS